MIVMNEQTEEYLKQHHYGRNYYFMSREEVEGLVELIVRNCVDEMITQMWHYGIDESNNPSFYKAVEKAKRQFGIEG